MNKSPKHDKLTLESIEEYLGYSAQREAEFLQKPIEEIMAERKSYVRMIQSDAFMHLDQKKQGLIAVTTTQAAQHSGMSSNDILKAVRSGKMPGFKQEGKQWRVWIQKRA